MPSPCRPSGQSFSAWAACGRTRAHVRTSPGVPGIRFRVSGFRYEFHNKLTTHWWIRYRMQCYPTPATRTAPDESRTRFQTGSARAAHQARRAADGVLAADGETRGPARERDLPEHLPDRPGRVCPRAFRQTVQRLRRSSRVAGNGNRVRRCGMTAEAARHLSGPATESPEPKSAARCHNARRPAIET